MGTPTGPLPPETFGEISERLKELDAADLEIRKAKQAGIDVDQQAATVVETRVKLMRIKQTYFPGR